MIAAVLLSLALQAVPALSTSPVVSGGSADTILDPLPAADWTLSRARHLADRAGFGGTPEQIAGLHAMGLDAAVELLVSAAERREPAEVFAAESFRKNYREMLPEGIDPKSAEAQQIRREITLKDRQQFEEYRAFWIDQMVGSDDPLREKLALFWHGYFTSAQREVKNSYAMARQVELYRALGASSFREILHRASKEPAMIEYLNNNQNKKQAPNENFAREVMELFTMGPGNYQEQDIQEAARAFTGWSTRDGEFVFARGRHDFGVKQFLGSSGKFDGDEILDVLLEQDATPRFVATKLFEFFVYPEPDEATVDACAKLLRANDYAIGPFLRALFRSRLFHSTQAQGAQFKSPVEFTVSTVRRLAIADAPGRVLAEACGQLGQELLNPPNVKGWEGGESWISASTLLLRANVARVIVMGDRAFDTEREARRAKAKSAAARRGNDMIGFKTMKDLRGYHPEIPVVEWITAAPSTQGARGAVRRLCDRLLPVAPSVGTVDELVRYVAPFGDDAFEPSDPDTTRLLRDVVHLILCLPEYQLN